MEKKLNWYVGFTRSCQEKKVAEAMQILGVEHYLPIQKVQRVWSDRLKVIDKMVIPRMVFVHTYEEKRIKLLSEIFGLTAYMNKKGVYNPVIVPDVQIETFRFMVEHANDKVLFERNPLKPGDPVEVMVGSLAGMRGELVRLEKEIYVAIRLSAMGAALVRVPLDTIRRYDPEEEAGPAATVL